MAIFFEAIRWLRGGLGNVVYFFVFISGVTIISIEAGAKNPMLDWLGLNLIRDSMGVSLRTVYPAYQGDFSLGVMPVQNDLIFCWLVIHWTVPILLSRLVVIGLALGVVLLGAVFFDRFDTSRGWIHIRKPKAATDTAVSPTVEKPVPPIDLRLTRLPAVHSQFRFGGLLVAELRLLLAGLSWWWYAVMLGL
jgi:hypothetical protein